MVDIAMLKDIIRKSGKTVAQIAGEIGIDESTFYRKMNRNGSTFTVEQAQMIVRTLGLEADTAQRIFFVS